MSLQYHHPFKALKQRDGLAGYLDSFCAHSRFLALSCSYSTSLPSSLCLSVSLSVCLSVCLSLSSYLSHSCFLCLLVSFHPDCPIYLIKDQHFCSIFLDGDSVQEDFVKKSGQKTGFILSLLSFQIHPRYKSHHLDGFTAFLLPTCSALFSTAI